jgi:hypothetical protein
VEGDGDGAGEGEADKLEFEESDETVKDEEADAGEDIGAEL